ncbi:MAG: hypothetical protein ACYSYL_14770 [Planctomycetota bacterium]|jgi:hypothetical protein
MPNDKFETVILETRCGCRRILTTARGNPEVHLPLVNELALGCVTVRRFERTNHMEYLLGHCGTLYREVE